ncbi:MAG: hypothetical protein OQJ97_15555 [Rhodospirillales bacterium]|nr:hypothetical protein [Rhodospirillales bacterium]
MRKITLVFFAITLMPYLAFAESNRYGSWKDGKDPATSLTTELRALISEAEKARAANPIFLQDLKDLVSRYDNPWRTRIIDEDFRDGDFTANPTWTVASGKFGMGWEGLISSVQPKQAAAQQQQQSQKVSKRDLAFALLGQVLNQGSGGSSSNQQAQPTAPSYEPGEIYLKQSISNSFAMTIDLTSKATAGGVDFVLFQGSQRSAGYRITSVPGRGIQILKVSSRGTVTLADSGPSVVLEDGKKHQLIWKRSSDGAMSLSLDGKTLFENDDLSFRQAFDGFSIINKGGEFNLHRLTIDGTS